MIIFIFVVLSPLHGINDHLAQAAFAFALGTHLLVFLEGEMDDAAVMGAHRTRCQGATGFFDFFAQLLSQFHQTRFPLGTIIFRIKDHGDVFPISR